MSDYLLLEKNLTKKDINKIYQLIDTEAVWVDGIETFGIDQHDPDTEEVREDKRRFKKNLQCKFTDRGTVCLQDIVYSRIDTKYKFYDFTLAANSKTPLLTRTEVGGYYKPHHDNYDVGDFSTTVFLNDDFEGGELCLWINGEEKKFKPRAGGSVTYKTGTPHRVNEVTKGNRDVVVFWTHTQLKDPFEFEMYRGLTTSLECMEPNGNGIYKTLEDANKDPHFILRRLQQMILRKHHRN